MKPRRRHSLQFKAKIALEALKGNKTMAELAREHQLDPKMIREWKNRFMEGGLSAFETAVATKQREDHEAKLYEKIGRLEFELDWLKKKAAKFD